MCGSEVINHVALDLTSTLNASKMAFKDLSTIIDVTHQRDDLTSISTGLVSHGCRAVHKHRCADLSCGSRCEGTVGFWTKAPFNQSAVIARVTQTSAAPEHYHSLPPDTSHSPPLSLLFPLFKTPPAGDYRPTVLVFLFRSPAGNLYDCLRVDV